MDDTPLVKTGHFFDTTPNNYKDWVVGPFVKEEERSHTSNSSVWIYKDEFC